MGNFGPLTSPAAPLLVLRVYPFLGFPIFKATRFFGGLKSLGGTALRDFLTLVASAALGWSLAGKGVSTWSSAVGGEGSNGREAATGCATDGKVVSTSSFAVCGEGSKGRETATGWHIAGKVVSTWSPRMGAVVSTGWPTAGMVVCTWLFATGGVGSKGTEAAAAWHIAGKVVSTWSPRMGAVVSTGIVSSFRGSPAGKVASTWSFRVGAVGPNGSSFLDRAAFSKTADVRIGLCLVWFGCSFSSRVKLVFSMCQAYRNPRCLKRNPGIVLMEFFFISCVKLALELSI